MPNIDDLGAAGPLDGTELVEVLQDGVNRNAPVSALGGSGGIIVGTYTGTGASWETHTLPEACIMLFVHGVPASENVQAWAIAGNGGARIGTASTTHSEQLRLAADGLSFDVDGAGTAGLSNNSTVYDYVGILAP